MTKTLIGFRESAKASFLYIKKADHNNMCPPCFESSLTSTMISKGALY